MFMMLSTERKRGFATDRNAPEREDDEEDAGLGTADEARDAAAPAAALPGATSRPCRSCRRAHGDRRPSARADLMLASSRQRSCVASSRESSPTISPSATTRMRSLMLRTSGSSDEMRMMPMPSWASSSMRAWTSALAPTSMPRVGSSRMRTLGLSASHLASATFCWLPPDRRLTAMSSVRRPDLAAGRGRTRRPRVTAARSTMPARVIRWTTLIAMLSRIDMSRNRPWRLRSSGT